MMPAIKFSKLDQTLVWALATAAYRINNGYFKFTEGSRKKNIELIYDILDNQDSLLQEQDRVQGQLVREYIAKTATMSALRGTLDVWGKEMARVSQLEAIERSYDLHVIAAMPQTYARYLQREKIHQRLSETVEIGDFNLSLKDKVEIDAEVLENKWSHKWNTYYVTIVDTQNRGWFFAYRKSLPPGQRITVRGTVKRFGDRMIQLNRVKISEKDQS